MKFISGALWVKVYFEVLQHLLLSLNQIQLLTIVISVSYLMLQIKESTVDHGIFCGTTPLSSLKPIQ